MVLRSIYDIIGDPLQDLHDSIYEKVRNKTFLGKNSKIKEYDFISFDRHSILSASAKNMKSGFYRTYGSKDLDNPFTVNISYEFTKNRRINRINSKSGRKVTYGGMMSFSKLYEHLIRFSNGGVDFVQVYLNNFLKKEFGKKIQDVTDELYKNQMRLFKYARAMARVKKDGTLDRRTKEYAFIKSFDAWNNPETRNNLDLLAYEIKKDIARKLYTGRIPLNGKLKKSTSDKRKSFGLTPLRLFYATGQLIDNLIIRYDVASEGA